MRRTGGERGQSTVEFALILPLIIVVLLALVQVALVAYAQLAVVHVARETARAAAVDSDWIHHQASSPQGLFGNDGRLIVDVVVEPSPTGVDTVAVSVSYEVEPLIGLFVIFSDAFQVHADTRMMVES